MKIKSYFLASLILSLGGTLFSGYLSSVKFFEKTCAFNETCPYFLGLPACYFGFGLFTLLLVSTVIAFLNKAWRNRAPMVNTIVAGLGILFAIYISVQDLMLFFSVPGMSYTLLLPTCVYGAVFFIIVFILSLKAWKGSGNK